MHLKFKSSAEILIRERLGFVIVRVIDLKLKLFLLLEMELNGDLRNPGGAQIVVDDFRAAKLLPHVALFLEQHYKWI